MREVIAVLVMLIFLAGPLPAQDADAVSPAEAVGETQSQFYNPDLDQFYYGIETTHPSLTQMFNNSAASQEILQQFAVDSQSLSIVQGQLAQPFAEGQPIQEGLSSQGEGDQAVSEPQPALVTSVTPEDAANILNLNVQSGE